MESSSALAIGEHLSLPERLADAISQAIVEGELPPGARLSESELALRLNTSRTPVREALRLLANDHLVELTPRKGATVARVSARDLAEIYICRAYLYGLAARIAATRRTDSELAELHRRLEAMREAVAAEDVRAYFRLNVDFHSYVAEIADNAMLQTLMGTLGRLSLRFRFMSIGFPGRLQASLGSHEELISAFEARDGVRAEQIVREFVVVAAESILTHHFAAEQPEESREARERLAAGIQLGSPIRDDRDHTPS